MKHVASAPVEVLAVDVPGGNACTPQLGLEAAQHPLRATDPTDSDAQAVRLESIDLALDP